MTELFASCAFETPAFLITTLPDVTVNDAESNDAIPLFDVLATF